MKIALCSSVVPFIYGGGRNIVEWLESKLCEEGHQVERVYLPQIDVPGVLLRQIAAYRWVDLSAADRIICFRPPSYMIPHPHKILWFIHHIRIFYDLWDTPFRDFPDNAPNRAIRGALMATDTAALREAQHIFTNSGVVSQRLKRYNGVDSEVLYPPIYQPERFHCDGFNDEIAYICRIERHKRQQLLIDALKYSRTGVRLRICGASADSAAADEIRARIARTGVADRIVFEDDWISEEHKADILANCLAAAYLPLDEDSYGYPSLEASHSSKPVLTTTDSGGVLELVQDGVNGLVSDPDPRALAAAMDRLYLDRAATKRMGQGARERLDELNISWPHVIERLLA